MDLAKFEWLVTKGALYFCRADLFEDQLEGTLPSANLRVPRFFGFPIDPESDKGREFAGHKERIWAQFRRWSYVSCWYHGESPSELMWDRYAAQGTGVAIRSSFARMALALNRTRRTVRISDVEYADPEAAAVSERSLAAALARKGPAYSPEVEVRLTTSLMPTGPGVGFWSEPTQRSILIPVTLSHLIAGMCAGPNATAATIDHIKLLVPWTGLSFTWSDDEHPSPAI